MEKPAGFDELLAQCNGNSTVLQRLIYIKQQILAGRCKYNFEQACLEFPDEETMIAIYRELDELFPLEEVDHEDAHRCNCIIGDGHDCSCLLGTESDVL